MGVPKFFRYISERYPCLSELVKEYEIPEFDNLYLDMNGIIHMCSHPDDFDAHFRISEETIFKHIFHYIEVLFRMIKPQKLFFMAIDGVAPRAKMNQQRGRRFRSAKEAQKLEEKAREKGEILPDEARFDSNCITPGTEFMAKLQEQLKYFVANKISTDKLWQGCDIILSGHETPGEGEHKIMDYIRYKRSQPGYDPHTRHCLYGLDADLIMLGLCSHEPNFSLLREEVRFGKKSSRKKSTVEEINFYLLHLSLMREYLELEFKPVKEMLPFEYDMESIIDDWVLMGFLVGNDFIPNLPNLHIANGALPTLYKAYMNILPKLDGYINENGTLHLQRFQEFMKELEQIDMESFSEHYADLKYFESKTGRLPNENERTRYVPRKLEHWQDDSDNVPLGIENVLLEGTESAPKDSEALKKSTEKVPKLMKRIINSELEALIKATNSMFIEPSDENLIDLSSENGELEKSDAASDTSSTYDDLLDEEFKQHKKDYYMNKLDYTQVTPEVLKSQAEGYVRAIQWNLNYYYNGVCSWSWYYPHHYAPFISDINDFQSINFDFELGKPFKPFEQLLSVLPAASKNLLPEAYHKLMLNENSTIKEYYPEDFKTDLNGKKQEWEAVVLIPFIDETLLWEAMAPCNEELSLQEVNRNTHGPMLLYTYSSTDLGPYKPPEYFPTIEHNFAKCTPINFEDINVPRDKLIKGAYPGIKMDVFYPGFPTLKHLKYSSSLKVAKVKVFDQPSRGESMIIKLEFSEMKQNLETIAGELLGKTVLVAWPHMVEAIVVSVSSSEFIYTKGNIEDEFKVENQDKMRTWERCCRSVEEHYMDRLGIDVGTTKILIEVRLMVGRLYVYTGNGRVTLERQWANHSSNYPLQAIVKDISIYKGKRKYYDKIEELFRVDSSCFMLGQPHYGCLGTVLDSTETLSKGRLRINIGYYDEPNFMGLMELEKTLKTVYFPLHQAAAKLGISKHIISRLTGTILIVTGAQKSTFNGEELAKINVGLNLKFNKRNEEIPGYTKKDRDWLYSQKAIDLVGEYIDMFPKFFEYINSNAGNDIYLEIEVFPEDNGSGKSVKEIAQWIKQQPFYSVGREPCGTQCLEPDLIRELEKVIDAHLEMVNIKNVLMQVKPHLLHNPEMLMGCVQPDATANYRLYDRVVNIRESYTVPLGYTGTVTAIRRGAKPEENMYDILFDKSFPGGLNLNCSSNRGYRMSCVSLINKSHGARQMESKTGKSGSALYRPNNQQNPVHHTQYYAGQHLQQQQSAFARNYCNAPRAQNFLPPNVFLQQSYTPPRVPFPQTYQPYIKPNPLPTPSVPAAPNIAPRLNNDFMPSFSGNTGVPGIIKIPQNNLNEFKKTTKPNDKHNTEESDNLKKLLGINIGSNAKTENNSTAVKENMMKISVQDIFAHATKTSQQSPLPAALPTNNCLQLLSYCQSQGLGCPHYMYLTNSEGKYYARILINGEAFNGEPANSKEEASEKVAKIALEKFKTYLPAVMKVNNSPLTFPSPPKQWCQTAPITPPKNKEEVNKGSKFENEFVPLQVVKNKVSKSSTSKENTQTKSEGTSNNKSVEKLDENKTKGSEKVAKENPVATKPIRQRKMRIAANLPGLNRQN